MDYEKAYKAALEWMRDVYPTLTGAAKEDAEHYFPELRESNDEKIRKEIIHHILYKANGVSEEQEHSWVAYLEKQKPAEWSKKEESFTAFILEVLEKQIRFCNKNKEGASYAEQIRAAQNWLKSLRPQSHWKPSVMQIGSLRLAIDSAKKAQMNATADNLNEIYEQLKKL